MEFTQFVSWEFLATFTGAVAGTVVVTQFTKNLAEKYLKLPTQVWSFVIALIIILLASFFTGTLNLSQAVLSVFNAVIISFAAKGGYDTFANKSNERGA